MGKIWNSLVVASCVLGLVGCGANPAGASVADSQKTEESETTVLTEGTELEEITEITETASDNEIEYEDIEIKFEHSYVETGECATITAYYKEEVLWQISTPVYEVAQLDRVTYHGEFGGKAYVNIDGHITAYDMGTGDVIWENEDFAGGTASVFDEAGNLYAIGYFGPDLTVISPEGKTLKSVTEFDSSYYWPYEIKFIEDKLHITYEAGGDAESAGTLAIDPVTWEYEVVETE